MLGKEGQQCVEKARGRALDLVEKLQAGGDHPLGVDDLVALLQLRQVEVVQHVEGREILVAGLVVVVVPALAVAEEDLANQVHELGQVHTQYR